MAHLLLVTLTFFGWGFLVGGFSAVIWALAFLLMVLAAFLLIGTFFDIWAEPKKKWAYALWEVVWFVLGFLFGKDLCVAIVPLIAPWEGWKVAALIIVAHVPVVAVIVPSLIGTRVTNYSSHWRRMWNDLPFATLAFVIATLCLIGIITILLGLLLGFLVYFSGSSFEVFRVLEPPAAFTIVGMTEVAFYHAIKTPWQGLGQLIREIEGSYYRGLDAICRTTN